MPRKSTDDQVESYRQASERLIVLLSASRHQNDILEDKQKRLRHPLYALINFAKAIDFGIQHVLGVSPHSLAHIIPPEKVVIDEQAVADMQPEALLRLTAAYDARFAVAERRAYLRRPKESLGRAYRYLRGGLLDFVKKLLHMYRGRQNG